MSRPILLAFLASMLGAGLLGCAATDGSTPADFAPGDVGTADEEVRARSTATFEGTFRASTEAPTGFEIEERRGPEDREVVAVDLGNVRLPGALLDNKTLRIKGRIEKRQVGTLPNGTRIERDVLVAREVIEKTDESFSLRGTLERRGSRLVLVERIPENAPPVDQDVTETALELGTNVPTSGLVGKKVKADGVLARKFTGSIRDRYLISQDLVLASSLTVL